MIDTETHCANLHFDIYSRFVQNTYSDAAVELKRLESNSYSPIFSHFGETLSGIVTVRAFRKVDEFTAYHIFLLNVSNRAMWPLMVANRWLSSRLQGINVLFAYMISLLVGACCPQHSLICLLHSSVAPFIDCSIGCLCYHPLWLLIKLIVCCVCSCDFPCAARLCRTRHHLRHQPERHHELLDPRDYGSGAQHERHRAPHRVGPSTMPISSPSLAAADGLRYLCLLLDGPARFDTLSQQQGTISLF